MSLIGIVKWFNNKDGFGFITLSNGEHSGKDIFVHYTSLSVKSDQYTYLVQGEYVQLDLTKPEKGDHEFHAINVSGILGGPLMCETRKQITDRSKATRPPSKENTDGYQKVVKKSNRPRRTKPAAEERK